MCDAEFKRVSPAEFCWKSEHLGPRSVLRIMLWGRSNGEECRNGVKATSDTCWTFSISLNLTTAYQDAACRQCWMRRSPLWWLPQIGSRNVEFLGWTHLQVSKWCRTAPTRAFTIIRCLEIHPYMRFVAMSTWMSASNMRWWISDKRETFSGQFWCVGENVLIVCWCTYTVL